MFFVFGSYEKWAMAESGWQHPVVVQLGSNGGPTNSSCGLMEVWHWFNELR
jgi:hypothetical protein